MNKTLITLFAGTLLLTACSGEVEAQEPATPSPTASSAEPATASAEPTPTETYKPPTEAELIAWVKSREGFDDLHNTTAEEFLDTQALRFYGMVCGELSSTALPSQVFDHGVEHMVELEPRWGMGPRPKWDTRLSNETFAEIHKLAIRRPIQYEVATTVRCPEHKEAFQSWVADFR